MQRTRVGCRPGRWFIVLMAACWVGFSAGVALLPAADPPLPAQLDLLVVAPHSDDEAIGCATVIARAVAEKQQVGVAVLTAGDGFPRAAAAAAHKPIEQLTPADFMALAALRQRHTLQAMQKLGVRPDDLYFLGYPDGGLAAMYETTGSTPYRQPYTDRTETYGPVAKDYRSQAHGQAAPYVRQALVDDLAEIVRSRRPLTIYVTGESDSHADHRLAGRYARDGALAGGYRGDLWTFVVHGRPPQTSPDLVVKLTPEEIKAKRLLLESYQVGVSPVHDRLAETYTQPEECFWRVKLSPPAR